MVRAGVAVTCRVVGPARLLPGHNRGRVFTDLAVVLAEGGQGMATSYPDGRVVVECRWTLKSCGLDGKPAVTSMYFDHVHGSTHERDGPLLFHRRRQRGARVHRRGRPRRVAGLGGQSGPSYLKETLSFTR